MGRKPKEHNEETVILQTTNYQQFKKLNGNRPLNKSFLNILEESILNNGNYLKYNPILVNKDLEVIDGQHRLKKAEDLQLPIYYIVAPDFKLKQAQILNSRKRGWTSQDFLNSYLAEGHKEYQVIDELSKEYRFSITIVTKALQQNFHKLPMDRFRDGTFTVIDRTWAEDFLGVLSTIREYSPDYCFVQSSCQRAVQKMMEKLSDPKIFERKLKQYQTTITRRNSANDYLKEFQLILDAGGDNKIKLL